jgi:hypothetical protein
VKALVNTVMNLWVPENAGKFLNSCTIGGFSRRAQLLEVSYKFMIYLTVLSVARQQSRMTGE